MKAQYASDLHLEFPKNRDFITTNPLVPKGDILLLAGDIIPFTQLDKHEGFLDDLSKDFEAIYWIPGNHEYYHSDLSARSGSFEEPIRKNITLLNNRAVIINGHRFIFSTLWSHISPQSEMEVLQSLNDFNYIKFKGRQLTVADFNAQHGQAVEFLKKELRKDFNGKTTVITHHVPTLYNYPEQYKNDPINEAFAVELYDLITETQPDYWIYGHHHTNIPDFTIGRTRMLTNQLGYVSHGEHGAFDRGKTI